MTMEGGGEGTEAAGEFGVATTRKKEGEGKRGNNNLPRSNERCR